MGIQICARDCAPHAALPRGEPAPLAAVIEHAEGLMALDAPRIEYSEEAERALEAYTRATGV